MKIYNQLTLSQRYEIQGFMAQKLSKTTIALQRSKGLLCPKDSFGVVSSELLIRILCQQKGYISTSGRIKNKSEGLLPTPKASPRKFKE